MTDGLIRSSADMVAVFRSRAHELGLTHLDVDEIAGLPSGYFGKIACGMKNPGARTIERICRALRLGFAPIVTADALECVDGDSQITDAPVNERSN